MLLEPLIAGYNCVTQGRSFNQHPTAVKRSNKSLRQAKKRGCALKCIDLSLFPKRNLSLSAFENPHTLNEKRVLHDVETPLSFSSNVFKSNPEIFKCRNIAFGECS